jgi:OPA family glycerol-3-phosphate transporter-like MFS transporter
MTIGYAGYYLCRSDLAVSQPLIIDQFKGQGIDKAYIGNMIAWATLLYALGKFFFGNVADLLGGRRMFLFGMGGAVVCTLLFGAGGPALFSLAWIANRAVQSSGWVGMVKITSRWFRHNHYGSVMGIISLSYLFGDFLSRLFLGILIDHGWTWQSVFYISGAILAVIFVPTLLFIRNRPSDVGLPEPDANPESVFVLQEDLPQIKRPLDLMIPLFASPTFWVVCALSFGFTFMRETFNDWIPTYLHEAAGMTEGAAAKASALFPLFGGFSVLGVGFLSDRLGKGGRSAIVSVGLALTLIGLLVLAFVNFKGSPIAYAGITALIAFVMIGPYSFLAGAISMDFGGKQASSTAAGWIDGIGYLGGMISGHVIGKIAEDQGWTSAFEILAFVSFVSLIFAGVYWRQERSHAHL